MRFSTTACGSNFIADIVRLTLHGLRIKFCKKRENRCISADPVHQPSPVTVANDDVFCHMVQVFVHIPDV